jgi:hypothetical protein
MQLTSLPSPRCIARKSSRRKRVAPKKIWTIEMILRDMATVFGRLTNLISPSSTRIRIDSSPTKEFYTSQYDLPMVKPKPAAKKAATTSRAPTKDSPDAAVAKDAVKASGATLSAEQPDAKPAAVNNPRRPRTQDSAHALLALGNDLSNGDEEDEVEIQATEGAEGSAKKRKLEEGATAPEQGNTAVDGQGTPKDFWYWLPVNQPVGDWDVLCGRGGESNNYVGNKKYRIVIKERKVSE